MLTDMTTVSPERYERPPAPSTDRRGKAKSLDSGSDYQSLTEKLKASKARQVEEAGAVLSSTKAPKRLADRSSPTPSATSAPTSESEKKKDRPPHTIPEKRSAGTKKQAKRSKKIENVRKTNSGNGVVKKPKMGRKNKTRMVTNTEMFANHHGRANARERPPTEMPDMVLDVESGRFVMYTDVANSLH